MPDRDDLRRAVAAGDRRLAFALARSGDQASVDPPFRLKCAAGGPTSPAGAAFVPNGAEADELLILAHDSDGDPVLVDVEAIALEVRPSRSSMPPAGSPPSTRKTSPSHRRRSGRSRPTPPPRVLDRAAVAVACDSLGLAAAMLDASVAYMGDRHQFRRPIGSFQAVKHACADMLVQISVGRELLSAAVDALVEPAPDSEIAAARASSFVTPAAVDVVGAAMQLHGGIGYSWESRHPRIPEAGRAQRPHGSPARSVGGWLAPSRGPGLRGPPDLAEARLRRSSRWPALDLTERKEDRGVQQGQGEGRGHRPHNPDAARPAGDATDVIGGSRMSHLKHGR